jgi:hypothetical protein
VAATWDDVGALARDLPQSEPGTAHGDPAWRVGGRLFVWMRPLRARDREELGDAAPRGDVVGATTADEGEKFALLAEEGFFTTAHFDGYAAILIDLDRVDPARLREVVIDAWLARAPKRLAAAYLAARS